MTNALAASAGTTSNSASTRGQTARDAEVSEDFRLTFRKHPGGVAVITADPGDGPVGLTVTSLASVSLEPPIAVFSASALSSSTPSILRAETLVIHLLDADELEFAKLCATSGIDRFADPSIWSRLASGEPMFHAAKSWIRGRVVSNTPIGGSTLIAVQALEVHLPTLPPDADGGAAPLVYHNRAWHVLGEHSKLSA